METTKISKYPHSLKKKKKRSNFLSRPGYLHNFESVFIKNFQIIILLFLLYCIYFPVYLKE